MKFLLIGILIVTLIRESAGEGSVEKGNEFMDELLTKIKCNRSAVYSLDPLKVPKVKTEYFETQSLVVTGLSKLNREGNCSVVVAFDGSSIVVCRMAADDLIVDFNYWAKALFVWFQGDGVVKIDKLLVELKISFIMGAAKLEKLDVLKLGDFHVKKINGLSILFNWMLKLIAESIFNRAKEKIRVAITKTTEESIRSLMEGRVFKFT